MTLRHRPPTFFLSMPHPCSYLPARMATTLFIDPQLELGESQYGELMRHGFRRSGDFVYRPHCRGCSACVPVRIPVERFRPSRGQRRTWGRNADLRVTAAAPVFHPEHFQLYRRYQAARHPGSTMDDPDPEKYISFLVTRHIQTLFYEVRLEKRLMAVMVTDPLPDGLSAVYTFFDPDAGHRGLGVYAILWEIAECRRRGLPWLYLGYWIADSPKMAYKTRYRPLEAYQDGRWRPVP